jgi:GntR family phosphonate transport system transcriptional regulator
MTELSVNSGISIWRQIAEALGEDVSSGAFKPGEKLPTEAALSERFRVNRHTVRRAIAELADRGMVRVERGRGMFVAEDLVEYAIGARPRITEILGAQNRTPGGRLLRALRLPAEKQVADGLGMKRGTEVILIERLAEADGRPVSVGRHYFPAKKFPGLIDHFREEGSISRALVRCGVEDFTRLSTRVRARRATPEELRMLHLPPNTPVLETRAVNIDGKGRRIEFGISSFASTRVELLFES